MRDSRIVLSLTLGILLTAGVRTAKAVPSYARQTGLPCSGCHYTPPELNAAGRQFKLMGYIDRAKNTDIVAEADKRRTGLELLTTLPLSAWFETSLTSTKASQTGAQNGNFEFPQDISLFLAGAWTSRVGSFLQVTYNAQSDHFSMDNTDIRAAGKTTVSGKELVYGLTLNNNPTLEDLWNSTPAWGFPYIASDSAPSPSAAPLIQGTLAQDVAGAGGYMMWNQHLYAAATMYRSDHIGTAQPNTGASSTLNIRGVAPYGRVAWQQNGRTANMEVGAYALHVKATPNTITGAEDSYTDWGADFQYDQNIGRDTLSVHGAYIRENTALAASFANAAAAQSGHHLNTANINAEYHYGNRYSGAFGWFTTTGTADALLYPQAALSGSANGSPQSSGYIANLSWWPSQNVDVAVQYTGYTRFNGSATNYDGAGRNASDNNTVYVLTRFVF
ncbi:MAG: hypothetical protein KGK08_06380 [Acidobacteriota bacterium]|nr:hypothetical protein [Acidobacteriota bacterium]